MVIFLLLTSHRSVPPQNSFPVDPIGRGGGRIRGLGRGGRRSSLKSRLSHEREKIFAMVGYDRPFEILDLEAVSVVSTLRFERTGVGVQHQLSRSRPKIAELGSIRSRNLDQKHIRDKCWTGRSEHHRQEHQDSGTRPGWSGCRTRVDNCHDLYSEGSGNGNGCGRPVSNTDLMNQSGYDLGSEVIRSD
jgi:hypothetical protein